MRIFLVSLLVLVSFEGFAETNDNASAIASVTQEIREVCTQPSTQGQHWQIKGDAAGEVGVDLKLLKAVGVKGDLHFSKDEWAGVQQVLAADQARDNMDYRKCVEVLTPKFLAKIPSATAVFDCTLSNCAGINAGEQNIYVSSDHPPPERLITAERADDAVKTLQTAPRHSTVYLIYSGKNDTREVEDFYGQVAKLFLRADRWQIVGVEDIGPSMFTADGSMLTGEGVGCSTRSPATETSEIAKKAMTLTGYPCSRAAANWGIHNLDENGNRKEETTDIVISIGTRFIPPS